MAVLWSMEPECLLLIVLFLMNLLFVFLWLIEEPLLSHFQCEFQMRGLLLLMKWLIQNLLGVELVYSTGV